MLRPGLLTLRKPLPLARSIRWVPVGESISPEPEDPPLFISQGALREVIRHLRSDPEHELLGFLLGNLFEAPDTGELYTVITSAMRTGHVITEVEPVPIPEEEWLGMQLELRRRRAVLMGWYHSTPFVAPHPARLDLETHAERFPEPFQCGLVVATEGDQPTGGFFRLTSPAPRLAGAFLAFHEVVDDSSILPGGLKRTLVDWANYRTEDTVEADRTERRPHLPPRRPAATTPPYGAVTPPYAGDLARAAGGDAARGAPATAAPANGYAAGGTPAGMPRPASPTPGSTPTLAGTPNPTPAGPLPLMIPSAMTWEDLPDVPPPPPQRRHNLMAVAGVVIIAAAVTAGAWWFTQRGSLEPRGALSDILPAVRSAPPAVPRAGVATPLDTTAEMTGDTSSLGISSSRGPTAPAASGARPGATTGGTAAATPAAPAAAAIDDVPATAGASSGRTPSAAAPRTVTMPAPSSDARLVKFDSLADSLAHAVQNFEDRDADFTLKRIGCRVLAMGYRAADDAFIALATHYRGVRDVLDDAREARYDELTRGVEKVNTEFDQSKCERP